MATAPSIVDAAISTVKNGTAISIYIALAPSYGNSQCGIYINNKLVRTVFVPEGVHLGPILVPPLPILPGASKKQSVTVVRFDEETPNATAGVEYSRGLDVQHGVGNASIDYTWPYEIYSLLENYYPPGGTDATGTDVTDVTNQIGTDITDVTGTDPVLTSGWQIEGLQFKQVDADGLKLTRGSLTAKFTVRVGTGTEDDTIHVTLSNKNQVLASGHGPRLSLIILSGIINAQVYVGDLNYDMTQILFIRWSAAIDFFRSTSPGSGFTLIQEVNFTGVDTATWTDPTTLINGIYYFKLQCKTDTGSVGPLSEATSLDLNTSPLPGSNLHYASGTRSACVLSFTESPTSDTGLTYNVYVQDPPNSYGYSVMDTTSPVIDRTSDTNFTLSLQNGISTVLVRAVNTAGIEENAGTSLTIEFENDVFVNPRPNVPGIQSVKVYGGSNCQIIASYNKVKQLGAATHVALFLSQVSGVYDFAHPDQTQPISTGYYKRSTFTVTDLTDGYYYLVTRAVTAGGVQSDSSPETSFAVVSQSLVSSQFAVNQVRG